MTPTDRRSFLKTIGCFACMCGFGSIFKISAANIVAPKIEDTNSNENNQIISELEKNEAFALHWITELLESLEASDLSEQQKRIIIKQTSRAHHDLLNVPLMVEPYIGKPAEFIEFLQNAWGWIVTENKPERTLIVNENKPFCVCPLLKKSVDKLLPALCYCSEGFAERMFSLVYEKPVSVKVAASVQRGDPSCVYHINY